MIDPILDLSNPINPNWRPNDGLLARLLVLSPIDGGRQLYDARGLNHGVIAGGALWGGTTRPGGFGQINFSANGHQVTLSPISLTVPYTFAAWLRVTAWNGSNPGLWRDAVGGAGTNFNIFQDTSGRPWIRSRGGDILRPGSGYSVTLNEWVRCVFRVSSTASAFAANGIVRHTGSGGSGTAAIYQIGWQNDTSQRLSGGFDDFCFWPRAITDAEILADFNDSRTGYPQALNWTRPRRVGYVAAGGSSVALDGTIDAVSSASSSLSLGLSLSGQVDAAASTAGSLSLALALSGSIDAVASISGALSIGIAIVGSVDAEASTAGALSIAVALSGSVSIASTAAADHADLAIALSGSIDAVAAASASISLSIAIAGMVEAAAVVTGTLTDASAASVRTTVLYHAEPRRTYKAEPRVVYEAEPRRTYKAPRA